MKETRGCSPDTCNVRLGSFRVFLTLLYATAGRLDEIRSIKTCHPHLDVEKPYVILIGKREKIRTAYLLPKVASYIRVYLKSFHGDPPNPEAYLFYSRVGGMNERLSEAALAKRIKICAAAAHEKCPDVPLDAHAHQFRHYVESGKMVSDKEKRRISANSF